MRPEDRDAARLWDMLEASRTIIRILGNRSLYDFTADQGEIVRLAVERTLEILGEAARGVSKELRRQHPELPWKDLVGLRNVISHQYEKVDDAEIYRICREQIPGLIELLVPLVPPPPKIDE